MTDRRGPDPTAALNPEQLAAVTHGEGPQLVLAGAGTGKTRVITRRLAWLARERGVAAHDLAAITFTNKAAREMAERVGELLRVHPLPAFVGTFHRFSLSLLRRWGDRVGLPRGFAICDGNDQLRLVGKAMKAEGIDERALAPRAVLAAISSAKNALVTPERYERDADDFFRRRVARVYLGYQKLLAEAGGIDFDDMISLAVRLLREDEGARGRVRDRIAYLMVDEFQDTNHAQLQLVHELVGSDGNLTAVGDEDQSIYRWRGAEISNILDFEQSFPDAVIRRLERNYRSTRTILAAAGAVVEHNVRRRGKRLWTEAAGSDEPVLLYRGRDEHDEARWILDVLQQDAARIPLEECAILVRTHAQTRALEDELLRRDLPYELVGGVRFYERAEIKDVLAYLRLVRQPSDLLSLERVLNQPPRGIGDVSRARLENLAEERGLSLWEVIASGDHGPLKSRAAAAVRGFRDLLLHLREEAETLPLPAFLRHLLAETGYLDLYDRQDPEGQARLENLEELLSAAQDFAEAEGYGGAEDVLEAFLDRVALQGDVDEANLERGVALMTFHSAKGLEFDTVVVAGLEDGLLPHFNSQHSEEDLEEERRLLYVGMTRARRRLVVTCCARRRIAGVYQDRDASPFLREIPADLLREEQGPSLFGPPAGGERAGWGSPARRDRAASDRVASHRAASERVASDGGSPTDVEAIRAFFGRGGPGPAAPPAEAPAPARVTGPSAARSRPTARSAEPGELKRGTTVRHQSLGEGTVLATEGAGDNLRLTVYFPAHGRRKLVARYARLEVV